MLAHLFTAVRLLAVAPVAVGFARPGTVAPWLLAGLVGLAIATDALDGPVARRRGTASPGGMLFDHSTDCLFVTGGLAGAALAGLVTPALPVLIAVAFGQYVFDSDAVFHQKRLRMSRLGRWNGVLYFAPLVVLAVARLDPVPSAGAFLLATARLGSYALVASTVASIIDRATAARS